MVDVGAACAAALGVALDDVVVVDDDDSDGDDEGGGIGCDF